MDVFEAIEKRKSVRRFSMKAPLQETIDRIVLAGIETPSAGGKDPVNIRQVWSVLGFPPEFGRVRETTAYVILVIYADIRSTIKKYGIKRGMRYIWLACGHAAQNVYLACTALGLGTVAIGAFKDRELRKALGLADYERVSYLMPIGYPKEK